MMDADWREILSFSQRELAPADREALCERLCWMEGDDIELNFTDLKTLFRLAQDILKFKSEQVNNLLGQIETTRRKSSKMKVRSQRTESPTQTNDSTLEMITHQEEIIKANKEILEQLYIDIAELEGRKSKLEDTKSNMDLESESSRDALSEMNAVAKLEHEITTKNKHIRKLLVDIKILEEENVQLKEKVSILKDKLTEATQLINNLTEQLLAINNELSQMKVVLGKSEQAKVQLSIDLEELKKEFLQKEYNRENMYEDIKSKAQHWKNVAKSKKTELDMLFNENKQLKEDLIEVSKPSSSSQNSNLEELKIKELQDKLLEATSEIEESVNIINLLKAENKHLKSQIIEEPLENSITEPNNESDEGKERAIINKLKKKVKSLTISLRGSEEMVTAREKELTEITSQLQLLQSDEGIQTLLEGIKNKKRQLKLKDEGIKNLVQDVNTLNELVNDLQLENETLRRKFNVPQDTKIKNTGILKNYNELQQTNSELNQELKNLENNNIRLELNNRNLNLTIKKMESILNNLGYDKEQIIELRNSDINSEDEKTSRQVSETPDKHRQFYEDKEMEAIIEENKGLRDGLQEILNFLKDNSKTSSGILTLKCPSLEAILLSIEARNSAGWFSPHMSTILELRAALGGKDALLTALHEARKDTFDVMDQLHKEIRKSSDLEQKLQEIENKSKEKDTEEHLCHQECEESLEYGSWVSDKELKQVDFYDKNEIENYVEKGNYLYEVQLRKGLEYFQTKFKLLFDKMSSMTIQATDDLNKWAIQEEQYKAEIENLRGRLQLEDDDSGNISPGLVATVNTIFLQRKCSYLEESYKYIRTLNENMKNEILDSKKDAIIVASNYETRIQKLLLSVINLTDKLRSSIPIEIFWKQNFTLNDLNMKYRKFVENEIQNHHKSMTLLQRLEQDKHDVLHQIRKEMNQIDKNIGNISNDMSPSVISKIEQTIIQKQLKQVCDEIEIKNKALSILEQRHLELQEKQSKVFDKILSSSNYEESDLIKDRLKKMTEDNKTLKERCQHISSQLDTALLQLEDRRERQLSNDIEINMLKHQILDLQSTSDNKAIVARLSSEILVAHLQASECHKKIEGLNIALMKEKDLRVDAEEVLKSHQRFFDSYIIRYESKFRNMHEIMQTLRLQYQSSLPLTSVENYLNNLEELSRKKHAVTEKLAEIEDLQTNLITKHSIYDQILDINKNKCLLEEDSCAHKLKYIMKQSINARELEHINRKLQTLEESRDKAIKRCNELEKTLVLVNQGFEKINIENNKSEYEDIHITNFKPEDTPREDESSSTGNRTITLTEPKILKIPKSLKKPLHQNTPHTIDSTDKSQQSKEMSKLVDAYIQTTSRELNKIHHFVQTEDDKLVTDLKNKIESIKLELNRTSKELCEIKNLADKRDEEINILNKEKQAFTSNIRDLTDSNIKKDYFNEKLRSTIDELKKQLNEFKIKQINEANRIRDTVNEDNKSLLLALKQLEINKNAITTEYKQLLNNEREEYMKVVKELHIKIMELQSKLDRRGSESSITNGEALKEVITKYTMKISEYEDKCFKLQSELDECKSNLTTYQTEAERWKELATERLTKMEQLNSQLGERHCHEVESYKAENQHWLAQLNDMQREHIELRTRLTEQKTIYVKQLSDRDAQIEQLRSVVNNLKTQVMNMQTLISVNDPSFDLSAIVEVDECTDVLSQPSDRLELKFDSSVEWHDVPDDVVKFPASSTAIWQETIIERLRREKQLASKQNVILRRQIKVLASREKRARLDAQNLKNQVFRISTTGSKVATAETAALQNKIASLQAQLTSARRDTHSSIALWDKWKRSQQAADRWQARYEEKCQEMKKLETSLNLAKSAVTRFEREKRILLSRLTDVKHESQLIAIEKQDGELQEKYCRSGKECLCTSPAALPVSSQALLDRVEAQQRRIAALELAEKGNELLVSEYEKSLAEITSLKGQVLKLESTLLESQIRTPIKSTSDPQPELDYWKSYCDMLKEENVQLNYKLNATESTPTTAYQQRVNDLEQTVLTLRGLVSKLQAEQKTGGAYKKGDSRPNSGRSVTEKGRNQLESHRIELANLKRSIQDKDLLLERSKEMLKMAAEREDELLRENTFMRRQLKELTKPKEGFLSA